MDELPFNVSELADCLTAATPGRRDLYLRRLRQWGAAGVLPTVGAVHVGTGRSRRFATEQVYVAAVLLRLADLGLSIGALKAVADVLALERARGGDVAALWEEAKRPHPAGCVFAALAVTLDDTGQKPVSITLSVLRGRGAFNSPTFWVEADAPLIVVNLTDIFASVRL
jgi:hypothetical protein